LNKGEIGHEKSYNNRFGQCWHGELPDAAKYGDEGSNTLGNIAKNYLILVCQILSLWDWEILTV